MKQKTENRKPITSQLFGVPISITSKLQSLALVGEWLREYRSVISSRLPASPELQRGESVVGSKSIGFQSIGQKPANRKLTNLKQKTLPDFAWTKSRRAGENRKPITSFPKIVVTPNPEMIVAAQTDPEFLKVLRSADLAIPDGIGIVWALKLLGSRFSVLGCRLQVNRFSVSWFQTDKPKTDKPETENPARLRMDEVQAGGRKPKTDNRFLSRLSGLDLMESLIGESAKHGWRVMLLGGRPGIAEKAAEKLQLSVLGCQLSDSSQSVVGLSVAETDEQKTGKPETENPARLRMDDLPDQTLSVRSQAGVQAGGRKQKTDNRLQIKSLSGPQNISTISKSDNYHLISEINFYSPDLLFVAFGHGRQEKWLNANRKRLNVGVAMGVGGALDQIADPSLRPPAYINSIGLGWLYRLFRQPWRWKRQLALIKFVGMVIKLKTQISKIKA